MGVGEGGGVAVAFLVGAFVLYKLFGHVQQRVDVWLDPFDDAQGAGYQVVQALYAFARGGLLGTGLGSRWQRRVLWRSGHGLHAREFKHHPANRHR